jgi:molecular chaperone IbpA
MRTYDFTPLWRSTVGFDRVFDLLNSDWLGSPPEYPPYDIERIGDDAYVITMALAGFSPDNISVTAEQNLLTVEGKVPEGEERDVLYRGIAARPFAFRVRLEDHVEVDSATYENGLLQIHLIRKVPERMRARRIEIGPAGAAPSKPAKTKQDRIRAA